MLILIILVIILCVIFVVYTTGYNKFQDYIIRINEVESSIDSSLRNKYDLLSRSVSIIKTQDENVKNDSFEEIVKLRSRKISNFDLQRKLVVAYNELLTYRDKFEEISNNEEIEKIIKDIEDINDKIEIEINYYNKNISEYNKLISKFPYHIIALLNKYQEKLYFDRKDMSDNDFEDFKL
jgi:hypothetical protein